MFTFKTSQHNSVYRLNCNDDQIIWESLKCFSFISGCNESERKADIRTLMSSSNISDCVKPAPASHPESLWKVILEIYGLWKSMVCSLERAWPCRFAIVIGGRDSPGTHWLLPSLCARWHHCVAVSYGVKWLPGTARASLCHHDDPGWSPWPDATDSFWAVFHCHIRSRAGSRQPPIKPLSHYAENHHNDLENNSWSIAT